MHLGQRQLGTNRHRQRHRQLGRLVNGSKADGSALQRRRHRRHQRIRRRAVVAGRRLRVGLLINKEISRSSARTRSDCKYFVAEAAFEIEDGFVFVAEAAFGIEDGFTTFAHSQPRRGLGNYRTIRVFVTRRPSSVPRFRSYSKHLFKERDDKSKIRKENKTGDGRGRAQRGESAENNSRDPLATANVKSGI